MALSTLPYITPLATVSQALIHGIGISGSYREAATRLLKQTLILDTHLCQSIDAVPTAQGADYILDMNRLDWTESRQIFLAIRQHKDDIDARCPLLSHAASLVDYISHMTTNLLPMSPQKRRLLAVVPPCGTALRYADTDGPSFELSMALYMGLSPFPVFGLNVPYENEGVVRSLSPFGLGVATYLMLALRPEIAHSRFTPPAIDHDGFERPVARAPIAFQADGSITNLFRPDASLGS